MSSRVQLPFSFSSPATVSGATVLEPVVGTTVAVVNRDTGLPATVWQAEVGPSTYSSIATDAGGNVPGWVDPGSYRVQAAAQGAFTGAVINFEAVRGDAVTNIGVGTVGANQIQPGSVTLPLLAAAVAQAFVPTGTVLEYVGVVAPTGYFFCAGSIQAQTNPTFATLFSVIGTSFNIGGEGAGNFRLPDYRGRVPIGAGTGSGLSTRTLAQTGGEENHTLSQGELPAAVPFGHASLDYAGVALSGSGFNAPLSSGAGAFWDYGGGAGHNNLPPYLVVNHIIKL